MDGGTADCGALSESVVFLFYFRDLSDPRQQGKVIYPLKEVLLLCLLAVLAGAETFTDIALFGEKKLGLLRRFLPFGNGTPRMTGLARSLPRSMRRYFSAALYPG